MNYIVSDIFYDKVLDVLYTLVSKVNKAEVKLDKCSYNINTLKDTKVVIHTFELTFKEYK